MATVAELKSRIATVRSKERTLVAFEGMCRTIAVLIVTIIAYFLLDWLFDLPHPARLGAAAIGLGIVGYVFFTRLVRELRKIQDDDAIALRVEARNPDLRDRLISTLQLLRSREAGEYAGSDEMLAALEAETVRMSEPLDFFKIISTETLTRVAIIAAIVLVVKVALVIEFPDYFKALAVRLVRSKAQFPTKTGIKEIKWPKNNFVPRGEDLPIEVVLDEKKLIPKEAGTIYFQGKSNNVPVELAQSGGTSSPFFKGTLAKALEDMDVIIHIGDVRTESVHIRVVNRPDIDSRMSGESVRYTQPAYTGDPHPPPQKFGALVALVGSTADIEFASTKPLASAKIERSDGRVTECRKKDAEGKIWTVPGIPIDKSGTFHLAMVDTDGLMNNQPPIEYPIDARPDLAPGIKLIKPSRDVTVTPTARPNVLFSARDDFAVRAVWLVYRIQHTAPEGQPEVLGDLKRVELKVDHKKDLLDVSFPWELSALNLKIGDQIVFWLEADDDCTTNDTPPQRRRRANETEAPVDPAAKAYSRSADIKLTVVSRADKAAELQAEIDRLYQQIERSKNTQEELKARIRIIIEELQKLKAPEKNL